MIRLIDGNAKFPPLGPLEPLTHLSATAWSVAKCRGSWVVGRGRRLWVWEWVNVVGKKSKEKNDKKIIIIINRKKL